MTILLSDMHEKKCQSLFEYATRTAKIKQIYRNQTYSQEPQQ